MNCCVLVKSACVVFFWFNFLKGSSDQRNTGEGKARTVIIVGSRAYLDTRSRI
ncbi:hypothetical protein M6B38_356675 [Iris pallida]|uniref:Uncharacterized protein n=1 Tax=Iris pallida TaxID=29817 RepID=A0AAX6GN56_IRIPA|nr:hypothetical protein M6B38_356675 [Iris pallida]